MITVKENIEGIVNLFLNFEKLIPNSKQLNYKNLKSLLIPIIDEDEFEVMVSAYSATENNMAINNNWIDDASINLRIKILAERISSSLTINQKVVYITILAKLIQQNNQVEHLINTLYSITNAFKLNKELTDSILELFLTNSPLELNSGDSLLLTNSQPDFLSILDGNKVIFNPEFEFKLLVRKLKSRNILLFKFLEFNNPNNVFMIKEKDVIPYNNTIQLLLNRYKITYEKLNSILDKNSSDNRVIEISPTELTPYVLLDSKNNVMKLEGYCIHPQPQKFFEPILIWLDNQRKLSPQKFEIHIKLRFLNTYSSKIILELLFKLQKIEQMGCDIEISWYYEKDDTEMKESGELYSSLIEKDFHYVSYDSTES